MTYFHLRNLILCEIFRQLLIANEVFLYFYFYLVTYLNFNKISVKFLKLKKFLIRFYFVNVFIKWLGHMLVLEKLGSNILFRNIFSYALLQGLYFQVELLPF